MHPEGDIIAVTPRSRGAVSELFPYTTPVHLGKFRLTGASSLGCNGHEFSVGHHPRTSRLPGVHLSAEAGAEGPATWRGSLGVEPIRIEYAEAASRPPLFYTSSRPSRLGGSGAAITSSYGEETSTQHSRSDVEKRSVATSAYCCDGGTGCIHMNGWWHVYAPRERSGRRGGGVLAGATSLHIAAPYPSRARTFLHIVMMRSGGYVGLKTSIQLSVG